MSLKIGMISFAHSHADTYLKILLSMPGVIVSAIADDNKARVEKYVDEHGISYFADYLELLKTDVDAVIICSENVLHAQMTIDAAMAGKHVLCEKPLGISVDEMQRMIETCKEQRVQLMTAFPCRYIPAVIQAKAAIERGDIGEILAIKGTNRGTMPGGWFVDPLLSGGGAVLDHTVHVMDLVNWILGSSPIEVYAESGTLFHDIPVDDSGMVHVKFADGVFAVIDTSWSRTEAFPFWGDVTMEIIGTEGVISIDSFAQKNEVFSNKKMKTEWKYCGVSMNHGLIQDFVDSLLEKRVVPITGEDGLYSARVALAAYDSIQQGLPVSLSSVNN
ncbi:gfo/Idh/MocA family oxidoreductase [Paenibacillus sp. LMG 31456]|uniref:Gfo/Idh/MocA family oxidoreductase n=1 Tax=Paenibacillus foliorum TaxID=2654974 RepID=A0A972GZB2_9BACL|nr:Gfo/Idh/MocA family oxidoreductase [Paenibacillus foliorum]NOU96918.1 gfo/Idh/MocA family oxidoreductase [Paenibacillus foliorum]